MLQWFGAWLLSLIIWVFIGAFESYHRIKHGAYDANAYAEGGATIRIGWFITGIIMLGVWCIWFS